MKIVLNKSNVEWHVTRLDVKLLARDWYIKVMEKRSTTSGITVLDHYLTYQLAWLVVTRTGFANLLLRLVEKHVLK
mgnify:CR=1 FL=1